MQPLSLKRNLIFGGILLLTAYAAYVGTRTLLDARSAPAISILRSYRIAMNAAYTEMGSYPLHLDQIAYKVDLPGYSMHSSRGSVSAALQPHLLESPALKANSYFLVLEVRIGDRAELWGIRNTQEPFRIFP